MRVAQQLLHAGRGALAALGAGRLTAAAQLQRLQQQQQQQQLLHQSALRRANVVPIVIEQDGRSERAYDVYSRLLKDRVVCLMGPVTPDLASAVVAQLLFLQSEAPNSPVHMYINSPGGSVTAGLAIYDTMQYITSPVATYCIGEACSMGSLLLQAGAEGQRHALPHSRIMIHQPLGSAGGQATDMQIQVTEILRIKQSLIEIYARHTGQQQQVLSEAMERDRFMTPAEAVSFGLIDSVLERPPPTAGGAADGDASAAAAAAGGEGSGR